MRLSIYFIIGASLVFIVIYHILVDHVRSFFPLLALGLGFVLGLLIARMFQISWDHGAKKAISHMDEFGIIILVLYVVFEIYRDEIIEHFVHGPAVVATSFALLAGVMIGRLVGIRGRIKEVVHENLKR